MEWLGGPGSAGGTLCAFEESSSEKPQAASGRGSRSSGFPLSWEFPWRWATKLCPISPSALTSYCVSFGTTPLNSRSREGQVSVICFPMVWLLAQHHLLLLKHLPPDKGSDPNRMRHEYAKLKLRPPQRSRSHENCYWVPTGVCTVPHFSCGTIVLHLHLTGTVLVSH